MSGAAQYVDLSNAPDAVAHWVEFIETKDFDGVSARSGDRLNMDVMYESSQGMAAELLADRGEWYVALGFATSRDRLFDSAVWRIVLGSAAPTREVESIEVQVDFFVENWDELVRLSETGGIEERLRVARRLRAELIFGVSPAQK